MRRGLAADSGSHEESRMPIRPSRFRCSSRCDPLRGERMSTCLRYLLRIPETNEALEYRNVHTGAALLPPWGHFQRYFLPHAAKGCSFQEGVPETATYLGQVLTLVKTRRDVAWTPIQAKRLDLDPELLVGTARSFKDSEGQRLPQTPERKDYTYVRFTAEDYKTMIAAGSNLFMIGPEQEQSVRDEPVFYVRVPSGKAPLALAGRSSTGATTSVRRCSSMSRPLLQSVTSR